jgi:hypothetical protein
MQMRTLARVATLGAMIGFAVTSPAAAENGSSKDKSKGKDPNEKICEKQEVLGSRLAVKRVCMTRAEWEVQRRSDRDLVQRSQMGVRQANPCGRPGC